MSTYQCSLCFYISDLNPEVIEKFQTKAMFFHRSSLPKRNLDLTPFSLKYWSKCALKSLKRRGLARLASARRTNMYSNGSIILFSQIYPLNSDLLLPRKGPVPERRNNSIPGINMPYFRDDFIPGINSVPERRNSAIQGINLG